MATAELRPEAVPERAHRAAAKPGRAPHGRLSANLVANVFGFLVNVAVGVFLTPYLVRHLGMAAYGVIPLATTVTSYLTVITLVVNSAVGRFITVALERGDVAAAREYFNTSLTSSFVIAAALVAPGAWLAGHASMVFRLPAGYETDATWLLACTVGAVLVSLISGPLEVATFCRNRFDVRNLINVGATVGRVALVVVLFAVVPPRIYHVGIGVLVAALGSLFASGYAWRRLTPELRVRWSMFDRRALRELARTGGWVAVSQLGTLLLVSVDLFVVNRLFGPEASGRYASLLQWPILLRMLAMTLAGVLGPTIIALYAREDTAGLVRYSRTAVKVLGIAMALPVGLIGGLSGPILHVWLGPAFVGDAPLLALMTIPLCVNLGYVPLHHISTATNNVRLPGITQLVAGALNVALAMWLANVWGMYGVAAAGILLLSARNVLFTPLYAALIIRRRLTTFIGEIPPIVLSTVLVAATAFGASRAVELASWSRLVTFGAGISLLYAVVAWKVLLRPEERAALKSSRADGQRT